MTTILRLLAAANLTNLNESKVLVSVTSGDLLIRAPLCDAEADEKRVNLMLLVKLASKQPIIITLYNALSQTEIAHAEIPSSTTSPQGVPALVAMTPQGFLQVQIEENFHACLTPSVQRLSTQQHQQSYHQSPTLGPQTTILQSPHFTSNLASGMHTGQPQNSAMSAASCLGGCPTSNHNHMSGGLHAQQPGTEVSAAPLQIPLITAGPSYTTNPHHSTSQVEKMYWERTPMAYSNANAAAVNSGVGPSVTSSSCVRTSMPQQQLWNTMRPPVVSYPSYPSQMIATGPTGPSSHATSDFMSQTQQSPYMSGGMMMNGTAIQTANPTFVSRQYVSGPFFAQQPPSAPPVTQQNYNAMMNYEPNEQLNLSLPGVSSLTYPARAASACAAGNHGKSTVSLGTPASPPRSLLLPAGLVLPNRHPEQKPEAETTDVSPAIPEGDSAPQVEEVDVEPTPMESARSTLPPIPATVRSTIVEAAGPQVHEQHGIHNFHRIGAETARPTTASGTRLSYESSMPPPLTERPSLTTQHQRVTSSPACVAHHERLGTVVTSRHTADDVKHKIERRSIAPCPGSDLLKPCSFWPVLNPLIDMLRLIEVADYKSTTSFKSLSIAVSSESSAKDLVLAFGDSYEVHLQITDASEEKLGSNLHARPCQNVGGLSTSPTKSLASSSYAALASGRSAAGVLMCAGICETEDLVLRSCSTGNHLRISVTQLILSGLMSCQGKYQLSDTEHINFGLHLSREDLPFASANTNENAPTSTVAPASGSVVSAIGGGFLNKSPIVLYAPSNIQYQIRCIAPVAAPSSALISGQGLNGIGAVAKNGGGDGNLTSTTPLVSTFNNHSGPGGPLIRHSRELSADCLKAASKTISSARLFMNDGMPAYNRLLVKIESFEGFDNLTEVKNIFLRASLGGGVKGYRCKVENWLDKHGHAAEFDFDYRGNRTIKFSIINSSSEAGGKDSLGTTQLNLLALLALNKSQFHGSLPVNHDGQVIGRVKVVVLFTNATPLSEQLPSFKAFTWPQALVAGSFIKITLHLLRGSLEHAHDPLFFRVSCGSVKVRSAKFTPSKTNTSLDLKDEVLELPITKELLAASEQKDFILCVYSRYNSETSCHTASHYVKIMPSVIELPSSPPRRARISEAIMTPASQEFASEDFLITFTFSVHN